MMMTSAKMPAIIRLILIPMFVDLDVGDPNIGFPGTYVKVQVPLWEMKLGGMGPLKSLFCISPNNSFEMEHYDIKYSQFC